MSSKYLHFKCINCGKPLKLRKGKNMMKVENPLCKDCGTVEVMLNGVKKTSY